MNKNAYEKMKRLSSNFSGIPVYPKNLKVLNKWMKLLKVEDFDNLKILILKEKFIPGLPYESKKCASEQGN